MTILGLELVITNLFMNFGTKIRPHIALNNAI
jgi:hypothetical protein